MQKKSIAKNLLLIDTVLMGLFVSLTSDSSVSAYSLTVTTSGSVSANVLPSADGGIGTTVATDNIGIISNCRAGYTMTIAGPSDNNLYLNGDSTNNTSGTYFTPVNGTSALNNSANANKWGYSTTANTESGIFSPLTSNATTLLTPTQTASPDSDINTTIPIYYGTAVNNNLAPGSYTFPNNNSITYTVVMDATCMTVNIAYDGNNADAGTMGAVGTGVIHTNVKDGDTVNLIASNFSRTGYGFAGWSLDKDAGAKLIDNDNTNNPIVYGPQETITLPVGFTDNDTDNDGIVKLYAVWIQSQGNLQGWMGCNDLDTATYDSTTGALDLTKNSVTALTDMRDHDTYAVARLADGQCWMIENLRLEAENTRTPEKQALAQGYGTSTTYGNFGGLADAESTGFTSTNTANSLYYSGTQEGTASINIGTTDYPAYRMPRYNNLNTPANASNRPQNPTSNTFANDNTSVGMYSYGNYYTWHAAMANTIYYNGPTAQDADGKTSETVNTSLCPTGWRLPYGGDTGNGATVGGFSKLDIELGGTGTSSDISTTPTGANMSKAWRSFPNNFLYSGSFGTSSTGSRGSRGYYWSSTASSSNSSYNLSLYSSSVYPGADYYYKYYGFSIRCTIPSNLYAIHFDANTNDTITGTIKDQLIAEDATVQLSPNTFQRPASSSTAYRFVKWNTQPNGSGTDYTNEASVTNLAAVGQTITLYAQWEQVTPMTVDFNGNGLSFDDSSTTNTVYYYNDCETKYVSSPSYSHTSNINDDGTQIGTTKYDNNLATKDVITVPGATSLHATITYGTENNYDMLYVFQGEYTGSVTRNMSAGQLQKYMGGSNTTTTVELDIPGDTATFAFYSDSSGQYWGYHASVVGYYDTEPASYASTTQVCSRVLLDGEYNTPVITNRQEFLGWSENQSATIADHTTADEVLNNLPGNNGETKTLYAIWRSIYKLTFVNTATNATQTKTVAVGQSSTVAPSSTWSRTGYKLIGWDTVTNDASGSTGTAVYTNAQSITPVSDMTFYTVWRPTYTVQYDGNGSDNDSTGMGSTNATTGVKSVAHTNVAEGDTFDLFASNFKRAGYGFVGWSTDANAWAKLADNDTANDAKIWGPNEVITAPAYNGTPIITLYAIWAPAETSGGNPVYLQGWTGCSAMTATTYNSTTSKLTVAKNSITALTDQRDNQVYTIAKLADENCWMVENLRLDNTSELSTTNTNIDSSSSTLPITNEYGSTTSNYLSATSNSWCITSSAACNDQSRLNTTNTIANITPSQTQSVTSANAHTNFNNTIYSYGNYYNWYSATAGYGTYSKNSGNMGGDLCPAGWKLPYGGNRTSGSNIGNTKGGFYFLANQMSATDNNQINSNKFRMFPNNFLYSGYWNSSSASNRGNYGYYLSASAYNSGNAYSLRLISADIVPGNNYNSKYNGYSVRCVSAL